MKNCTKYTLNPLSGNLRFLFIVLFLCFGMMLPRVFAQCDNDVTPPNAVCKATVSRDMLTNGSVVVTAQEFDNGSTDNCTPAGSLSYFIQLGPPSATPPSTTSLSFTSSQVGTHSVVLWVVDTSGNASYCTSTLQLLYCYTSLVCNDLITIKLDTNNTGLLTPDDGLEGGPYCSFYTKLIRLDPFTDGAPAAPSIILGPQHIGTHVYSVSLSPLPNSCWGNVKIIGNQCIGDQIPPAAVCKDSITLVWDTTKTTTTLLHAKMPDNGSSDNCTAIADLEFRIERQADFTGTPPNTLTLALGLSDLGTHPVVMWVRDQTDNWNYCIVEVTLKISAVHTLKGTVYSDANADCQLQGTQEYGLAGWEVHATGINSGKVFKALTNALGQYQMLVDPAETAFEVALDAPINYGGACGTTDTVYFPDPSSGATITNDIAVLLNPDCPLLFVDLATPRIRICFPGTYFVRYANASAIPVADTYVKVTLDDYLTFQGSSVPATYLGNQVYRFETGDLDPGETGQFVINFYTDCAAPQGATHCSEAHIFPDTLCPAMVTWSGANVSVEGACVNDSIFLKIKNTGTAPNAESLEFIVVEDVLMLQSGQFSLNNGAELALAPISGNGATYRLQAQQEPGHPYGGMPAVAVEGCGGFTPGMVTLFATNNPNPFIAVDCQENVFSYDPNDKQALPKGYAAEHLIEKNTPLDYTIRFQNTGTDTAYRVVIIDTLSSALQARAARPGAASHPYRFELLDGHILRFTFDDILLPDSNVNAAASQGFVQFSVPQAADNTDGTRIENTAAIYFDGNAPVITNQVFHTLGNHFIAVATDDLPAGSLPIQVYPNPAGERVYFDVAGWSGGSLQFTLTDALGRVLYDRTAKPFPITLECGQLTAGTYFFRIVDTTGGMMWTGKVLVR